MTEQAAENKQSSVPKSPAWTEHPFWNVFDRMFPWFWPSAMAADELKDNGFLKLISEVEPLPSAKKKARNEFWLRVGAFVFAWVMLGISMLMMMTTGSEPPLWVLLIVLPLVGVYMFIESKFTLARELPGMMKMSLDTPESPANIIWGWAARMQRAPWPARRMRAITLAYLIGLTAVVWGLMPILTSDFVEDSFGSHMFLSFLRGFMPFAMLMPALKPFAPVARAFQHDRLKLMWRVQWILLPLMIPLFFFLMPEFGSEPLIPRWLKVLIYPALVWAAAVLMERGVYTGVRDAMYVAGKRAERL